MRFNVSKNTLIKAVLSIVLVILVIFVSLVSYNYVSNKIRQYPEMSLIVKFKEVPPVVQRFNKIEAYYRGCLVGSVSKMELSKDHRHVLFHLDIYYKDIKLPKNLQVFLDSGDLYGSRYMILKCPETPCCGFLKDGDIVCGTGYYERIDKFIVDEYKYGKLGELVYNAVFLTGLLKTALEDEKNSGKFVGDIAQTKHDIQIILKSIREILDDPQFKKDLKLTAKYSSGSLEKIAKIMDSEDIKEITTPASIRKTIESVNGINKNMETSNSFMPVLNDKMKTSNALMTGINKNLDTTNRNLNTLNTKMPEIPDNMLINADESLKSLKCWSDELSEILSKRFVLLRFMFGNPGKPLKKCKTGNCNCRQKNCKD